MLVTKTPTLVANTFGASAGYQIKTKDPIRSFTINNTATHNVTVYFGEMAGQASDVFTIPPSSFLALDVWDLEDEDIHELDIQGTAGDVISVIYKVGVSPPHVNISPGKQTRGTITA